MRVQFQGYKHISLVFLVVTLYELRLERVLRRSRASARSGDLFGERQVLMMWATEGRAHPLDQLVSTQQSLRFHDAPLAVRPLGLYGIQPRALLRQVAAYDPYASFATFLHLPVVLAYPPPNLLACVPAGVVPHQHQNLLAHRFESLRAPRKEALRYGAHGTAVHEAQPRLLKLRHEQSVAGDGLRIGIVFDDRLLDQARGLPVLAPGVQRGQGEAAPPGLVLEAHSPPRVALRQADQPVAAPFSGALGVGGGDPALGA